MVVAMNDMTNAYDVKEAIDAFPRLKARTLRFGCGAPRSARVIGDGSRALFLRSDGPEDLVTALWMSVLEGDGSHREVLLADPRELLANADSEDVPAEEKARRERAREGGTGIVSYSVDAAGRRVIYTINGRLFLTEIDEDGDGARTRQLAASELDTDDQGVYGPVLNPCISPDGKHVLYTTGEHLELVDIADWESAAAHDAAVAAGEVNDGVFVEADADEEAISEGAFGADEGDRPAAGDVIGSIWGVCGDACACGDRGDERDGECGCGCARGGKENTWRIGLAEFAAGEEMDRYDGFWWAPDSRHILFERYDTQYEPTWYISDPANPETPAAGRRYPRALTRNVDAYLTIAELEFDGQGRYAGVVGHDVQWDRDEYEYIAAVSWSKGHGPLVLVQNRRQTKDQVLEVAPSGAVSVLETHANDQWIDLVPGTPAFTPDGRLVCPRNDMDTDTNRLTVDGKPFTPVGWQVRGVLDVTDADVLVSVQRTPESAPEVPAAWADNVDGHDARSFDVVSIAYDGTVTPVTTVPGQWTVSRASAGIVVSGRDMAHAKSRMEHLAAGRTVGESSSALIANHAADPGFAPNIVFTRLGEHRLYTAIIAPSAGSRYAGAEQLPVLMKPYGGPGYQQVIVSQAFYWDAQWWADQGFLVVTADGRGTTGRGPKWDREIFEDMKDVTLADQVEAVHALPEAIAALNADGETRIPAPNLDKVCMIGWSYGGFLSALAVLDAPETFHAGCAGAPPTDWTLYDTHYTERYLGLDPKVYRRNGIVQDAPKLSRPLMLIHGFADDNVTIAHSLRLSQALMAAGRPHTFLPLTGITHMTNDETVAENLLTLQRDFLYDALDL